MRQEVFAIGKPKKTKDPIKLTQKGIDERLKICKKLNQLFEMESDDYMVMSELVDLFDVSEQTINRLVVSNREAFLQDGMYDVIQADYTLSKAILDDEDIVILNSEKLSEKEHKHGRYISQYDYRLYPKRSVLRLAMLLRDSPVAKAVREQLLNTAEIDFKRSTEIKREIYLLKNLRKALKEKSSDLLQWAIFEYAKWRDRYLYLIQPFFPKENAIAALYSKFGMTPSTTKWRVVNQYIPSQQHPQRRTYQQALTAAVLKMAREFCGREELTQEELDIIQDNPHKQ